MAIELPRRGGGGSAPRPVRAPTAENVPQARVARDPGVRVPAGGGEGQALAQVGQGISGVSDRLGQVAARMQSRRKSIKFAKSVNDLNAFSSETVRNAELEQDLTDDAALDAVTESIRAKRAEILSTFDDDLTRAEADVRLSSIENSYVDTLSAKSVAAQRKLAEDTFGNMSNRRAAVVAQDPSRLPEQIDGIVTDMEMMSGAFTPDEERDLVDAQIANVAVGAMQTMLRSGEFDDAEDILASPELTRILPAQERERLQDRIRESRRAFKDQQFERELQASRLAQAQAGAQRAQIGLQRELAGLQRDRLAAAGPRSELLDDTGAVKRQTSGEIRRTTAQLLGGTYDVNTGETSGLNPEQAQAAQGLNSEVERILETGEENSIGQAVSLAVSRVELPEQLSFDDIADQAIAAIQEVGTTEAELERAPEVLEANKESLVDLSDATGVRSGLVDAVQNNILGQIDPRMVDTDVVAGRRRLALLENDFISSFKRSPRLPVWEQVRLSRIFSGPSVLRSPEGMRTELRVIDQLVTQEIDTQRRMLRSPIPVDQKQEALSNVLALSQFQNRIRDFEIEPAIPDIATPQDVEAASDEQLRTFIETRSDEDLNNLAPEVRDSMMRKLGGAGEGAEGQGEAAAGQGTPGGGDRPVARSQADVDALKPGREFLWQPSEDAEPILMKREEAEDGGN